MKTKSLLLVAAAIGCMALASCFGSSSSANAVGGELTGVKGSSFSEPVPFGMVPVHKGSLKIGLEKNDTLWGTEFPLRDISVDGFWMDQHEISNAKYRQFVNWVRDSIIRERLADPAYGGDETYKIEEDKEGNPITPHLDWSKAIPWRKANEDEDRAIQSVYIIHPIDGTKMLDASQMNYRYEIYDYVTAAQRKYRLNPEERDLNTDHAVSNEDVIISKDTAWIDDDGKIQRQTITRPLSGPWDFLNTYIVNIYPDTTCWVNDIHALDGAVFVLVGFTPGYWLAPVKMRRDGVALLVLFNLVCLVAAKCWVGQAFTDDAVTHPVNKLAILGVAYLVLVHPEAIDAYVTQRELGSPERVVLFEADFERAFVYGNHAEGDRFRE